MAADLLKKSKAKAGSKAQPKGKKELRELPVSEALQAKVVDLCEVGTIFDLIKPLVEQRKAAVAAECFDLWTAEMWKNKVCPENFRIVVPGRDDSGKPTMLDDIAATFQLKFNLSASTNGLGKKAPKTEEKLPPKPGGKDGEQMTLNEVLMAMLTSDEVGLPQAAASKFIKDEVVVEEEVTFAGGSFDKMYYGDDKVQKKIAALFLAYSQARPEKGEKTVTVEAFTDELENNLLVTQYVITLKADLGARIFTYCKSLEQLRGLLKLIAVTTQVADFKFGISDEKPKREKRLGVAVAKFIGEAVSKEDD